MIVIGEKEKAQADAARKMELLLNPQSLAQLTLEEQVAILRTAIEYLLRHLKLDGS